MSVPNYKDVVEALAAQHPQEWRDAHTGNAQTEAFIRRLAWVLHQRDPKIGLNGKRGNPNDISDDALCYDGISVLGDFDPTRWNAPVTVFDVIGGAGGPNPTPQWGVVGPSPKAAWVQPSPVDGGATPPGPTPPPPPTVDLRPVLEALARLEAKLDALAARPVPAVDLSGVTGRLDILSQQVDDARKDIQALAATPPVVEWPIYTGSVFGRGVTLRPQR